MNRLQALRLCAQIAVARQQLQRIGVQPSQRQNNRYWSALERFDRLGGTSAELEGQLRQMPGYRR